MGKRGLTSSILSRLRLDVHELGITHNEFSKLCGVRRATVYRWFNLKTFPTSVLIHRAISEITGRDIEEYRSEFITNR